MKPPIDGGVVLVTGASSGIGEEIARQLAVHASALILVARRRERLEALASDLRGRRKSLSVEVRVCDLTDRAALAALTDDLLNRYDVDILVNCAGLGDVGMFDLSSWKKVEFMLELNMRALSYLTHRFVGPMVARKRGGILMVSSGFGLSFMPGFAAYVGTKHYVSSFAECLRIELQHVGVVVTHVCPGPVDTEFYELAGNPTDVNPQKYIEISAARCARSAIAGFSRGKALVLPGIVYRMIMWLSFVTPRRILRLLYGPAAGWLRRRQFERARYQDAGY
jgi:short-subunit dehydrogenase